MGVRAVPAGEVDRPTGGALRAPPAGRPICTAGAAGTPKTNKIEAKFETCKVAVFDGTYSLGMLEPK